ncbi:MAG: hypothetical protein WAX14_21830 [Rhodococcus sp. (in: high G+C Gram-positive bacteria)]|uniref:hypothetical protein n=1 Tax=Rhodococcus sp. TaxID=1831 RepID=UPI003BB70C1B
MSVVQVDLDALRTMAYRVLGESDIVYELKPGAAFDSATAALAGPSSGAALTRAGAPTDATFVAFAHRQSDSQVAAAMSTWPGSRLSTTGGSKHPPSRRETRTARQTPS